MNQSYAVGQSLWGKIRFPDGEFPEYKRPYLIVGVGDTYLDVLTVSSIEGKEWKLTIPTNMEIDRHNPPFPKRSFVKLDSLQRVNMADISDMMIDMDGATLDSAELSKILKKIEK